MYSGKVVSVMMVLFLITTGLVGIVTITSDSVVASEVVGQDSPSDSGITRGRFWTDYGNGTVDRRDYPINYWNGVEDAWSPINVNIYRNYFGDYYWKNAMNTFDVYFKQYSAYDKTAMVFYNTYDDVRVPTEILFGLESIYWGGNGESQLISDRISDEGSVVNNTIVYDIFTDCSESIKIDNVNVMDILRISDIEDSALNETEFLSVNGEFTIDNLVNIYLDGVLWDGIGVDNASEIKFGLGEDRLLYALDKITVFDSVYNISDGFYQVWAISGNTYGYSINVEYDFISNATFPITIDPAWLALDVNAKQFSSINSDKKYAARGGRVPINEGSSPDYPIFDNRYNTESAYRASVNSVSGASQISYSGYTPNILYTNSFTAGGQIFDYYDTNANGRCSIDTSNGWAKIEIYSNNVPSIKSYWVGRDIEYPNDYDKYFSDWYFDARLSGTDVGTSPPYAMKYYRDGYLIYSQYDYFDQTGQRFDGLKYSFNPGTGCGNAVSTIEFGGYTLGTYTIPYTVMDTGTYDTWYYNMPTLNVQITFDYNSHSARIRITSSASGFTPIDTTKSITSSITSIVRTQYLHYTAADSYMEPPDSATYVLQFSEGYMLGNTYYTAGYIESDDMNYGSGYVIPWYINDNHLVSTSTDYNNHMLGGIYTPTGETIVVESSPSTWQGSGYYWFYQNRTGDVYGYESFSMDTTQPSGTNAKVYLKYYTGAAWVNIPDSVLPGNSAGYDGDGSVVNVDMSMVSFTTYSKIKVRCEFSTSSTSVTPKLDYFKVYVIPLTSLQSSSNVKISSENVSLESVPAKYSTVGNLRIELGTVKANFVSDPYIRFYYIRSATLPALNAAWTQITSSVYETSLVPTGWTPVANSADVRLKLALPNDGTKYSYLWFNDAITTSYTDYWFKAVIQDVSYTSGTVPSKVVYVISDEKHTIVRNEAPTANAGLDKYTETYTDVTIDAHLDTADGGLLFSGVYTLNYCEWKFTGPNAFVFVQNRTVTSLADGIVGIQFTANGTYVGKLTLCDLHGLIAVDYVNIYVNSSAPRVYWNIQSEAEPYQIAAARVYYYDATYSVDMDGTITWYNWSWGDGTWTNKTPAQGGAFISHTYFVANTYTVALILTDNNGKTNISSKSVDVIVGLPLAIIANSAGNDISGTTVESVVSVRLTLSGGLSSTSSGSISEYAWDWGDGYNTTTSEASSSHVYSIVGKYLVILNVKTTLGYTDDTFVYIDVVESVSNDTVESSSKSMGVNPRLEFEIFAETDYLELEVDARLIKDGWGGSWLEKYVSKEQIEITITRVEGPLTLGNGTVVVVDGNTTTNVTYSDIEVVRVEGSYFGAPINTGKMSYTGSIWDDLYVYVRVDGVYTLANKGLSEGVTVDASNGELEITFDVEWDEIVILTNPGMLEKLGNAVGMDANTPDPSSKTVEVETFEVLWKESE